MKKNINIKLNIIEFISFILCLLFMGIYLNNALVVKPLFFILGIISGFTFISIETFLYLVMNNKYRIIYIAYLLLGIILGSIINIEYPYIIFLVVVLFSLIKSIYRVLLMDKIYVGSRYKKYSKVFTSEVKDIKKLIKKNKLVPVTNKRTVKGKSKSKAYIQKDLV